MIGGLEEAARLADVQVFHAGTRVDRGEVVTDGCRVLGVTALGETLAEARRRAYEAGGLIHFQGAAYRRDIVDQIFESLAKRDGVNPLGDAHMSPVLADRWQWSPDSLSIAFHIDPHARWHDGVPVTPDRLFKIGSCTKTFVGAALMSLAQDGIVSLKAPVATWFPDLPFAEKICTREFSRSATYT